MATYEQQHFHYSSAKVPTPSVTSSDSALAQIVFGGPTTVGNDTVNVTDTWKGSLGAFSASGSVQYPRTFTCADVGNWPNTATIIETGQQSSANVLVTCSPITQIPGLAIFKTASPDCILSGTVVTYTYIVTNTGQTVLTNVVVTDDKIGAIGTIQVMNPGESVTLTKTAPITDDIVNVGMAQTGSLVATDNASVDVVHPAIDVEKTSDAPAEGVLAGTKVTYFYTVQNTGDVPLHNVNVVDDKLGVIATGLTLAVNQTMSLPSKTATITETVTNVVTATAVDDCDHQATDTQELTVETFVPFTPPDVQLEKSADGEEFAPGDIVTYTLTFTNIGDGPASNFTIVDDYDERFVSVEDPAGGDRRRRQDHLDDPRSPRSRRERHDRLHDAAELRLRAGHDAGVQHRGRECRRRRGHLEQLGEGMHLGLLRPAGSGTRGRRGLPAVHRWRARPDPRGRRIALAGGLALRRRRAAPTYSCSRVGRCGGASCTVHWLLREATVDCWSVLGDDVGGGGSPRA